MSNKWTEAMRKEVHSILAALTPEEAKALRARFGMAAANQDEDEASLRALARQLSILKKSKGRR